MTTEDLTAASVPVTLGGEELLVNRLTDRDISELNEWVRAEFIKMARLSLSGITDKLEREETLRLAMSEAAGISWMSGRGAQMMATPDGLARIIWQGCKDNHPTFPYEFVRSLMMKPGAVQVVRDSLQKIRPKAPGSSNGKPTRKDGDRKSKKGRRKGRRRNSKR